MRTRVALVWLLGSVACTPIDNVGLPAEGARSIVLVKPDPADGSAEIFVAELPASLLSIRQTEPTLVFTFDRPLLELGLKPGALRMASLEPRRDPAPAPLARYVMSGALLEETETTTSGLELPELDFPGIFRDGHCLEPTAHVSTVCGSTLSLDGSWIQSAAGPELLGPDGLCPEGWQVKELRVARGGRFGERVVAYCEPPPREVCSASARQAAGDAGCQDSALDCPSGDFAEDLGPGPVRYVLAGAGGGDGSRARPFGSLSQAMSLGGPLRIAVGKGQYEEPVILRAEVELVGACAAQTQIHGAVSLRSHRGSIRGLRLTATGSVALNAAGSSDTELREVVIEGAVQLRSAASLRFVDARLKGPLLELDQSEVTLRSSELDGSITATNSTFRAEDSALTATAASSKIVSNNTQLSLIRSWVGLSVFGDAGSTIRAERGWFTQQLPSARLDRNILRTNGPLEVRQCVFSMPEVLVLPQQGSEPFFTQYALVASGSRAELQDLLFLLAREESYANFGAVVANNRGTAPYHLKRGLMVGGTRQVQLDLNGRAEVEDWSSFDTVGHAISAESGDIGLSRVEGARAESVVQLGAQTPLVLRLRDLRAVDCSTGLVLRSYGGALDADVARIRVSGGRASGIGMSLRADAPEGALPGPVRAVMRDVLVDAEITQSLELGMDVELDLQDFHFIEAGYGIALRHRARDRRPPDPHHLRRGSIQADIAGVLLSDVPSMLPRLLDRVEVSAPTPVSP